MNRPVVAVTDVVDTGALLERKTCGELTDYLAARVTELLGYRVVPREQVLAKLAEAKAASYRPCVDAACQIELGKALAAEKTLATKILRLGTFCTITTTLFDLRTETAEAAASVRASCAAGAVADAFDRLLGALGERSEGTGQARISERKW
jgi:hypothetical protein